MTLQDIQVAVVSVNCSAVMVHNFEAVLQGMDQNKNQNNLPIIMNELETESAICILVLTLPMSNCVALVRSVMSEGFYFHMCEH